MLRGSILLGLGILGLALLVGTSESQEKKKKGTLPAGFKDLKLTAAQEDKLREIASDFKSRIDEANKKVKELTSERTKAEFAVLTDEQKQQYIRNKTGEEAKKKEAAAKEKAPEKDKKTNDNK